MIRLCILVEGIAEETFVNNMIIPNLSRFQVFAYASKLRNTKSSTDSGGGIRSFPQTKKIIESSLKQDGNLYVTTMFDLYRLPSSFPGKDQVGVIDDPIEKAAIIETALVQEIRNSRFIPYIQVHEFEALLLSDPSKLTLQFSEHTRGIAKLAEDCAQFPSPEHINDRPNTAPAKRIEKVIPNYLKSLGPVIAQEIGLPTMREKCAHFNKWLNTLEKLEQF